MLTTTRYDRTVDVNSKKNATYSFTPSLYTTWRAVENKLLHPKHIDRPGGRRSETFVRNLEDGAQKWFRRVYLLLPAPTTYVCRILQVCVAP